MLFYKNPYLKIDSLELRAAFIKNLYAAGLSWKNLSKDEALAYVKKVDFEFQAVSVSVFGVLLFTCKKYNESSHIKTNSATHFVEHLRKHIYNK